MAEINRLIWEKGDFGAVAHMGWDVGEVVVGHVGVKRGERVLDVACGTGNAAIRAAQRGGIVTGLDIVPALLDQGRTLAAEAGVKVEFVQGDAEDPPFEDASFDVVLSTFGCMFVPDHKRAASEIARVLRPDGRIGIASWTPEGLTGQFNKIAATYMRAPPEGFQPPTLWGSEDHVRELFAGMGLDLQFAREETKNMAFHSAEEGVSLMETKFGPLITARQALEPEGKWEVLRADMVAFFDEHHDDGVEYLVVTGTKRR
jgi:ubiquinone/menaquinone biosynthesis C-methylase UbiE